MSDPRAEYQRRRQLRQAAVDALVGRSRRISNLRVLAFLALLVALGAGVGPTELPLAYTLAPLLAFVALVIAHEGVERRRARAALAVEFYDRGLRRLAGEWADDGPSATAWIPADHPYAADLDLFGPASLFALVGTARTRGGLDRLASWLLAPASRPVIEARQAAVDGLRPRLDLREDLALLGGDLEVATAPAALCAWGAAPPAFEEGSRPGLRALAWGLSAAATAATFAWALTDVGVLPLLALLALEGALVRRLRPRLDAITRAIEGPARELEVVAHLLDRVAREDLRQAPRLAELQAQTTTEGLAGAAAIAGLGRLREWLDARKNAIFAPFAFAWMWELHFALAIEGWRARHGRAIAAWLDALAELEALAALAGYAYERPADPFPELVDDGPTLVGDELRHPLLGECVANSIALGGPLRVLMISGSNMSGKSTFLRTVGINAVLALAGAPIRGRSLRLSPLAIGATMRVEDSLREASSRFYAELQRLRILMDRAEAGDPPLLFLLDEIFHGTNSHDRKIGAEAIIRGLVEAGAIGLVTTHDLALAEAVTELGERAENVHFQDEVIDDRLVFDYRMRPGIVRRSNALALMRAVGLDV